MIDLHCHILPGVDDGASTWEMAFAMCRMAAEDGIRHIVATPHANFEYPYDRAQHELLLEELRAGSAGVVELSLGCDFHLSYENLQELFASPATYTIGNTNYLLVELSDFAVPSSIDRVFTDLCDAGLHPIITHPERNPLLQNKPEMILRWVNQGCLTQLTANSLTGYWGRQATKTARYLLDNHAAHVVSTDAHNTGARSPVLSPAVKLLNKWVGEERAQQLVSGAPAAILRGATKIWF